MASLASLHPILLPDSSPVRRRPNRKNAVSEAELERFDSRTLFFDVFIDSAASRLIAIGPPALNLRDYVGRTKLVINGQPTRYRLRELPEQKLLLLEARIAPRDVNEVVFEFPDFRANLGVERIAMPSGKTVLAAISKNNRIAWISQWVDFYRQNYPIDEVILYDNGSDNVEALEACLAGRATVIRWNFPYGPAGRRHNKFAQPGALNHCLRKFARRGRLYNFDIDELLIADRDRLERELSEHGTLYVDSYNVPFVPPGHDDYTHFDFTWRYPEIRKSARKFICRADDVDIISQHNTWHCLALPGWKRLRRNRPDRMTSDHAYFLHFLGITTNWQPELEKLKAVSLEGLVCDDGHLRRRPRDEPPAAGRR